MVGSSGIVGPWNDTHRHRHKNAQYTLTLMCRASVVGLKALHDPLNKRLGQQVNNRALRSMVNVVLYVHVSA